MCRPLGQRGARRPGARALARRLHHENPREIGRFRRHHRLRPDGRRGLRRAAFRHSAHRPRHSAARRHLRQGLRQQGQSRSGEGARDRSGHPAQGERARQTSLLRQDPLQGALSHRTGHRKAQALQTRRAALRKDRKKLQINRLLRRRPLLDQIRPHGLARHIYFCLFLKADGTELVQIVREEQPKRSSVASATVAGHRHVWTTPADQGLIFGSVRVLGAVMSSASHDGSSVNSFLPMAIRGELSFPQGIPC